MSELKPEESFASPLDRGLLALCQIAAYYRVAADPAQLQHQLGVLGRAAQSDDIARGAKLLQLKARVLSWPSEKRLKRAPTPALIKLSGIGFVILAMPDQDGRFRLIDPVHRIA
ncbi:MAG: type I secretion system permease/ATPase, partial [Hyphomicrobiales bacterium]|nr:type I secretion system permease/ATPase [Hyphomicrobiales bacterium]